MKKIRIGVMCPSEIAFRRFMPAIKKITNMEYVGISHANEEEWFGNISPNHDMTMLESDIKKAEEFVKTYGGKMFNSFKEIITSDEIDAVYIPLPPSLHYKWARLALQNNKHVLVEKPSTTSLELSKELVELASARNLAFHENYMFNFHSQLDNIEKMLQKGIIGNIRLFRIDFGFPFRGACDFRYSKKMGGGALLDCGGYTIKLAMRLLGNDAKLVAHQLNYKDEFEVDVYGSGTLVNNEGQTAQIAFGMDNSYRCDLDVWGSEGSLYTGRVMTAPDEFEPIIQIKTNSGIEEVRLEADDSFQKSILHFVQCIVDDKIRCETYEGLLLQAEIVQSFRK